MYFVNAYFFGLENDIIVIKYYKRGFVMKIIITLLISFCLFIFTVPEKVSAEGLDRPVPTQEEIIDYVQNKSFAISKKQPYDVKPTFENVGKSSSKDAMNMMNLIRLLSGINSVNEDENYSELAQSAAYIMNRGKQFSHYLSLPAGMKEDDLRFQKGEHGARSSNLGSGYMNISESLIYGYMFDDDDSNIDAVGHRKWLLDPSLKNIGVGIVNGYTATYVFDNIKRINRDLPNVFEWSAAQINENKQKKIDPEIKIAWPPEQIPIQFVQSRLPFSLSLGEAFEIDEPIIHMTNISTGQKIVIDSKKLTKGQHYSVSGDEMGSLEAIVWRPNTDKVDYHSGDQWKIRVEGLKKNGQDTFVEYVVNLFDLQTKLPELELEKGLTVYKNQEFSIKSKRKYDYSMEFFYWEPSYNDYVITGKNKSNVNKIYSNLYEINKVGLYEVELVDYPSIKTVVKVINNPKLVREIIAPKKISIKKGKTVKLKTKVLPTTAVNKKLKYSSANKKIATVSKTGSIKGISKGKAIIWVQSANKIKKKIHVTVK